MIRRFYNRLYRALFPRTARRADLIRAVRLREHNRKMQESAEKRQRQEDATRYLDTHIRYLDDVPGWIIDKDE